MAQTQGCPLACRSRAHATSRHQTPPGQTLPRHRADYAGCDRGVKGHSRGSRLTRSACGACGCCRTTIGRPAASAWAGVSEIPRGSRRRNSEKSNRSARRREEFGVSTKMCLMRRKGLAPSPVSPAVQITSRAQGWPVSAASPATRRPCPASPTPRTARRAAARPRPCCPRSRGATRARRGS